MDGRPRWLCCWWWASGGCCREEEEEKESFGQAQMQEIRQARAVDGVSSQNYRIRSTCSTMSHVPTHEALSAASLGSHTPAPTCLRFTFWAGDMRSCGKLIVRVYMSVSTAYIWAQGPSQNAGSVIVMPRDAKALEAESSRLWKLRRKQLQLRQFRAK